MISAIFPTDLEGAPSTRTGDIHTISFLVNVGSIILATVLLSVGLWSRPRWRTYRRTAMTLTTLVVIAFVVQFLTLHKGAPYGLGNRLFVTVLFTWLLATSFRLRGLEHE